MNIFGKTSSNKSSPPNSNQNRNLTDLKLKADQTDLPPYAASQVESEFDRLTKIDSFSAEFSIGLSYIETVLALPWFKETTDNLDLERAETILNQHHFGLQSVKTRVLEYLAVKTLRSKRQFRLLIVDDETIARDNICHYFSNLGYMTDGAENGIAALQLIEKKPFFDLIITDLKMDKMDGLTLIEKVRKLSPETDILMVTGYATVSSAVDALRKGATHYLSKPVQLEELKSSVEEILAKQKRLKVLHGPILCFSGPPGTGKTSICRSVASSLGREFVRLSMGGLRDEAEIYGHRRTYAGAMPGRIINEIKRAAVVNPCFLFDEIDKIGKDFRGDPASVLLEVLDPEQNKTFTDHYLEIPFDLSAVMFMATANDLEKMPGPLLDRLEIIEFPSYTVEEKKAIAQKYILPRQVEESGLASYEPAIGNGTLEFLINNYTRESGVRGLNREINTICRKLALQSLNKNSGITSSYKISKEIILELLGPRKFTQEAAEGEDRIGVVTGLVWTNFGGQIMFIETLLMRGTTNLILTGSLGEVLRESAQTALSYIRSNAKELGIAEDFFDKKDIHIHLPAAAVSKDGPSAGVSITLALVSLLTQKPVFRNVSITGEMTLSGHILPVGGIREKVLAAITSGCRKVVLPQQNSEDVSALPAEIHQQIDIVLADHIQDTFPHLLAETKS